MGIVVSELHKAAHAAVGLGWLALGLSKPASACGEERSLPKGQGGEPGIDEIEHLLEVVESRLHLGLGRTTEVVGERLLSLAHPHLNKAPPSTGSPPTPPP